MKKLTVELTDDLSEVEILMVKANIEGMAGVSLVLANDYYCTCKTPAFAPFIECEKCGLPPKTEFAVKSNICPDCGAMLVFGGCLNCIWKRSFQR